MTEIELLKKQIEILKQALKTISSNHKTPKWIIDICMKSALNAKKEREAFNTENGIVKSFIPGSTVYDSGNVFVGQKKKFKYEIVSYSTTIDDVNLWDMKLLDGDEKHPTGVVFHNMPENLFSLV